MQLTRPLPKFPAAVALCLAATLCLSGCPGPSNEPDDAVELRPFEAVRLRIAVPDSFAPAESWPIILDEWAARTGAEYELHRYQNASSSEGVLAAVSDAGGNAAPHLIVFPVVHRTELACRGLLKPMSLAEQDQDHLDWADYLRGVRDAIGEPRHKPTIVPLSAPVLVCYFRRDLLEAAGLRPPQTWRDYRKLLESLGDWAPGKTAVEPWSPGYRATTFLSRAAAHAKHPGFYSYLFDIDTGEPLIDTSGFVRALEQARGDIALMPAEVATFSPSDCRAEILAGRAALAVTLESGPGNPPLPFGPSASQSEVGRSQDVSSPRGSLREPDVRIGICRLPGAAEVYNRSTDRWESPGNGPNEVFVTAFSGVALGVGAGCTERESQAAWNLIEELTLQSLGSTFPPPWASHVRTSDVQSAATWAGEELTAEERFQYVYIVSESLRETDVLAELPVLRSTAFREQLTAALSRALEEPEASAAEILKDLAGNWREMVQQIGETQFRDCYREMLGLPPL